MARFFRFRVEAQGINEIQASFLALGEKGESAFRKLVNASPSLANALDHAKNSVDEATAAIRRQQTELINLGGGVRVARYEATNFFAQVQDTFVSLASGQSPFTVLVQQVPQAATALGSTGNLLKVIAAQITPLRVGLAATGATLAVLGLQAAALAGEQRGLEVAIKGAGKSAELSAGQFRGLVEQMRDQGVAAKDARKAIEDLIRTPGLSGARAVQLAGLVPDFAAGTGTEAAKAAEALGKAFAGGADGVKKLDEQINFLTAEEARNIREMAEHGQTARALDIAAAALGRQFQGLAQESLGPAEKAMNALGREYTSVIQGILNSQTAISVIKELADKMAAANRGWRAILNAPAEHQIVTLNAQLLQAKDNLAKFEEAGPPTLLGVPVGVEAYNKSLEERRRIVTDLQQKVDGLIAQQRQLADQERSTAAATGNGTSELERQQKAADELIKKSKDALEASRTEGVAQARIRAKQEAEDFIAKNNITDATIVANIHRQKEIELVGKYTAQQAHKAVDQELESRRKLGEEMDKEIGRRADQFEAYQKLARAAEDQITRQKDENEINALLAKGYNENSLAVVGLKQAKEEARVAGEQTKAVADLEAKANDAYGRSATEAAAAEIDFAKASVAAARGQAELAVILRTTGQAHEDLALKAKDTGDEATAQVERLKKLYATLNQLTSEGVATKAAANVAKEIARVAEHSTDRIVDSGADAIDKFLQSGKIEDIGAAIVTTARKAFAQLAAEAIIRPIIQPLVQSAVGSFPGLFGIKGSTALTPAGGGGLFGGGGFGGGNLFGGVDALASEYLPGVFQAPQSLAATASQYGVNLADVAGLPTTTPGFLPFAASDALPFIGATLPGLISGNYAQAATGLAGAGIGFALGGPPGAAIGGFLGNLVGGLFGGKKKTPAAGALIDIATGDLETKSKVMSADEVARLAQSFLPSVRQTASHYGLDLAAGTRVGVGYSEGAGYDLKLVGPGEGAYLKQFALDQQNPAEALADLTLAMVQMADAVQSADLKAAAATLTFADTAETINKVLEGALNFNKGLGPLADQLIALDAAAQEVSKAALDKVQAYLDIGTRIGGEAGKAAVQVSRDYLDTLLGLKDAAPVLSEAAAAFAQAKAAIIDLAPALAAANYSPEEIAARQSVATETLTRKSQAAFIRGLDARANPALAQVDQLVAQHDADLLTAAAFYGPGASAGSAAANSAFATAVDSFLKSLQPDALAGVLVDVATKADSASQYIARAAGALVQAGQAAQALSLSSPTNFDPGSALGRLAGILAQADPTGAKRSLGYLDRGDAFVDLINQVGANPTIESVANLDARLNLFGDRLQNGLPGSRSIAERMQSIAQQAAQAAEGGSLFKATNDNGAGVLASFGHSRAEYLGALRRLTGVRRLSETTDISDLSEQEIVDAITAQRDVMMQAHLAGAGVLGGVVASTRGVRDVDQRFAAGRSGTDFLSAATSLRDAEAEGRRQRERQLTVAQRQLGANEQAVRLLGEIAELIRTQPQALANLLNTVRSSADAPYRSTPNGLKWGA